MSWFGRSTSPEKQAIEDQGAHLALARERRKKAMAKLIKALDEIESPEDCGNKNYPNPSSSVGSGHD